MPVVSIAADFHPASGPPGTGCYNCSICIWVVKQKVNQQSLPPSGMGQGSGRIKWCGGGGGEPQTPSIIIAGEVMVSRGGHGGMVMTMTVVVVVGPCEDGNDGDDMGDYNDINVMMVIILMKVIVMI